MEKAIRIDIKLDSEKNEFANIINVKGFEEDKEIENTIFLVGILETLKQQELKRLLNNKEVKN
jgi:hypothetical protein